MNFIRKLSRVVSMLFVAVLLLVLSGYLYHEFAPVFGGEPDQLSLKRFMQSKQFFEGKFRNLEETIISTRSPDSESSLIDWFLAPDGKNPDTPIPSQILDQNEFKNGSFVWLGHSTVVMKTNDIVIITDPIFNRASPVPFIANSFAMQEETTISDLPEIDIVLISHDHYDHLDYKAVKEFASRVKRFYVPLGIKAHLQRWGVEDEKISEMDWFERANYQGIEFTLAPSRHFSGRRLDNQNSTLWGSWIVSSADLSVYFSGDGGYSKTFTQLGTDYGPFDIAFMENGAYSRDWSQIHMMPEEAVQAAVDLKARILFPIHWAKFDLAFHPWQEPVVRLTAEARKRNVNVATPLIGEAFSLDNYPQKRWW